MNIHHLGFLFFDRSHDVKRPSKETKSFLNSRQDFRDTEIRSNIPEC